MDNQPVDSSQPRLTRGQYWLFETAVQLRIPLGYLVAEGYGNDSSIELMFNKPGHGLTHAQLYDCLSELFRDGLIAVSTLDDDRLWIPTDNQIVAALNAKRFDDAASLFYGLTESGGATWEAFAMPAWDRFISEEYDYDELTGKVMCANRQRLDQYLNCLELNLVDQTILSDTVDIEELVGWQATYWKHLPSGFCASFRWSQKQPPYDKLSNLAFDGLCAMRDEWYRWR